VAKVVKDPQQLADVKEFFRERYKLIKDTYKYYASFNPVSDIWAIQNASFTDLVNKCVLIDNKVTAADINIKWTAVVSGIKGGTMLPAAQVLSVPEKKE
jgi:hypothetical protein